MLKYEQYENEKILEDISIYNYKDCIVLKELVELLK